MKGKFEIVIGDIPTEEELVGEIYYEGVQWVQIYKKSNQNLIRFYSLHGKEYWEFPLEESLQILEKAKEKFLSDC